MRPIKGRKCIDAAPINMSNVSPRIMGRNKHGCLKVQEKRKIFLTFGRILHLELEIDQIRFAKMDNGDYSDEKESRCIEHEKRADQEIGVAKEDLKTGEAV
jgi:hypothetical protein